MSATISATLVEAVYLLGFGLLVVLGLRAASKVLNYALELVHYCFTLAKSGGFTLKSIGQALAKFATSVFDIAAPLLVLTTGIGMMLLNSFGMIAFDPNPSLLGTIGFQGLTFAVIWRSTEAYLQHVQIALDQLAKQHLQEQEKQEQLGKGG